MLDVPHPNLRIEIREELARFYPDELTRWKNPVWWAGDHWRKVLPESEWPRYDKFRKQAALSRENLGAAHAGSTSRRRKGTDLESFAEVRHMRTLQAEGYEWRYENYELFVDPGEGAAEYRPGYLLAREAFGEAKMAALQSLAKVYRPFDKAWPRVPDLFAFRREAGAITGCHFIECKRDDDLSLLQLLGLALIKKALDVPVKVVRFVLDGKAVDATVHRGDFRPRTMAEPA